MQGKIIGTGLIALDVILNGNIETPPKISTGGSCGNVLTILSFLGYESYPIARLANNEITRLILEDFNKWQIKTDLISINSDGSSPIIIHRIQRDKNGKPKHRFEFRSPLSGLWFPRYKPILTKHIDEIVVKIPTSPRAFYFDRVNRASIELANKCRAMGAVVVFEPSSIKMNKQFLECLEIAHIVKFSRDRIDNYSLYFPKSRATLEIETLGEEGLKYRYKSNKWKKINSFLVNDFIDGAGAGDWCSAGIISILAKEGIDSFNQQNEQ